MLVAADVSWQDIMNSALTGQWTTSFIREPESTWENLYYVESSVKTPTQRYLICDDRKKGNFSFSFKISQVVRFWSDSKNVLFFLPTQRADTYNAVEVKKVTTYKVKALSC